MLKEPVAAREVELVAEPAVGALAQEPVAALEREPGPVQAERVVLLVAPVLVAPVLAAVVLVPPVLVAPVLVAVRRIAPQPGVPDRADELVPAQRYCARKSPLPKEV